MGIVTINIESKLLFKKLGWVVRKERRCWFHRKQSLKGKLFSKREILSYCSLRKWKSVERKPLMKQRQRMTVTRYQVLWREAAETVILMDCETPVCQNCGLGMKVVMSRMERTRHYQRGLYWLQKAMAWASEVGMFLFKDRGAMMWNWWWWAGGQPSSLPFHYRECQWKLQGKSGFIQAMWIVEKAFAGGGEERAKELGIYAFVVRKAELADFGEKWAAGGCISRRSTKFQGGGNSGDRN